MVQLTTEQETILNDILYVKDRISKEHVELLEQVAKELKQALSEGGDHPKPHGR